jgi:hypothetical protein
MAARGGSELILFVAGEPDSGADPLRDIQSGFSRLLLGSGQLFSQMAPSRPVPDGRLPAPPDGATALRLPADQVQLLNEVIDVAGREGRKVRVVDVNQIPSERQLIDRWVGPNDVFPLLVRPDGARLVGDREFLPSSKLRKFVRGG